MSKSLDTRNRILDSALDQAPAHGLASLSIGQLASATGMSKSGLFARFGGQDALQCAIIEAAIERFRTEVVEPARSARGALARLQALAGGWTDWLVRTPPRPCPILQAAFEAPALTDSAATLARTARREWISYIERLARLAVQEGALAASTEPAQFAFQFEAIGLAAQSASAVQQRSDARHLTQTAFASLFAAHRA